MNKWSVIFALACCVVTMNARAQNVDYRDNYPDTWVATDDLGRTMPDISVAGPVKEGQRRVVGMFYVTWHGDGNFNMKNPYAADVTKILAADPNARLDAKNPLWTEGMYHWGEPELGYFLSKDRYVIRKDISMLADAGVDVLVMDVTNAVRYWDEWDVLFHEMLAMKAEGNKVPQFCFWAFNGPVISVVQDLYEKIYKAEKYKDLWFYWDGKPLLLYNSWPDMDSNGKAPQDKNPNYDPAAKTDPNNPHHGDPDYENEYYTDYTKEVKNYFTLRGMWWGYYEWFGKRYVGTEDHWSFGLDMGDKKVQALDPIGLVSTHNGQKEEAAVTPAQHPSSLIGKSWTKEHGQPELNEFDLPKPTHVPWLGKTVEHPEGYGVYFQERWDDALKADPQFLYLNDWNEWSAGKYHPEEGKTFDFMRRAATYRFIDQYNSEFNRSIQPMKGGYTDNYYMQMAQNIRRYKGVRPIPELHGFTPIKIDGDFFDWANVSVEYRDTVGDTIHRDYNGYDGLRYTNDSGRNDIVTCKVAVDETNVYFYAETKQPLTPHKDKNWMLLFIDADKDSGRSDFYDYAINHKIIDDSTTIMERFSGDAVDSWTGNTRLSYKYAGNAIELAVPREELHFKGEEFTFDFHWCDNPADVRGPISLCTDGDSAPNRRFNYRCIWRN